MSRVRPLVLDVGCCGVSALRIESAVGGVSAEYANTLVVAGRISPASASWIERLYAQLEQPRWVIAFGTCALSGAVFDTVPVEQVVPVDVHLIGCPPPVEALEDALLALPARRSLFRSGS